MSRKKAVKSRKVNKVKKTVRRQPKVTATQSIEHMEKSFKSMPAQLSAHYRKEIATLKLQEKKLAATLKKAQALTKAIENKCAALAKANSTPKNKKQLKAAKQGFDKANQATKAMSAQLDKIKMHASTLAGKVAKFIALGKHVATFEKEWSYKPKVTAKPVAQKRKKSSKSVHKKANDMSSSTADHGDVHPEMTHNDHSSESVEVN